MVVGCEHSLPQQHKVPTRRGNVSTLWQEGVHEASCWGSCLSTLHPDVGLLSSVLPSLLHGD